MEKAITTISNSKHQEKQILEKESEVTALKNRIITLEKKVMQNFIVFVIYQFIVLLIFWFSKITL